MKFLHLFSLLFSISVSCANTKIVNADELINKFFYLKREFLDYNAKKFLEQENVQEHLVIEFSRFASALYELWVTEPVAILSVVRETIYFSFKHFFLQVIYKGGISSFFHPFAGAYFARGPLIQTLYDCYAILESQIEILQQNLSYNEETNKLLISKIAGLVVLEEEFAEKLNDRRVKGKVADHKFFLENLKFNYIDKTIDYNAFVETFHEFEFLARDSAGKERLQSKLSRQSKLSELLVCYFWIIESANCFKLFDHHEISFLLLLILIKNKNMNTDSPLKLNNAEIDAVLLEVYEQIFLRPLNISENCAAKRNSHLIKVGNNLYKEARNYCDLLESAESDYEYLAMLIREPEIPPDVGTSIEIIERFRWSIKLMSVLENHLLRKQFKKWT